MGVVGFREENPNWKGGRSIASNGYVIVRVDIDHHLADVRGYAYEHRLVAEKKIGRRLRKGEIVHHINGKKTDNRPENIDVKASRAEHNFEHRTKPRENPLRRPGEINDLIECSCGCGIHFPKFDKSGRPRRFMPSHNMKIRGY